jgi:hypothetical protein
MKTKVTTLITLVLMLAAFAGYAGTPQKTISIFGINGRTVEIPVKVEEAPDTIPYSFDASLEQERKMEYETLLTQQFDLSKITKPEPDADDITINTRAIFVETIVNQRLEFLKTMFSKK